MKTLVRKVDGAWEAVRGTITLTRMASTRAVTYQDGRTEEEACEPYPVPVVLDLNRVRQFLADGTWTEADIAPFGLVEAEPFEVPEGKQAIGAPSYVEADGVVCEVYELEDLPPPPAPPTAEERLAAAGLTVDELRALLGLAE